MPSPIRLACALIGVLLIAWGVLDDGVLSAGEEFGWTEGAVVALGVLNLVVACLSAELIGGWLAVQISVMLALVGAEFALRVLLSERYYSPFQYDERYHYVLKPGARREYRHMPENGGGTLVYSVNSRGFRGAEFEVPKQNQYRIAVYGDSFIQAEYSPDEATLPAMLEQALAAGSERPIEVINAGVAGYGPDQVLLRLEDELPWLELDHLVVGVFAGNDFGDLVRNKLYRLDEAGVLVRNEASVSPDVVRAMRVEKRELILKKIAKDAVARIRARGVSATSVSDAAYARAEAALAQHIAEYREYVVDGDNEVRELRSDPYSADISLYPESDSAIYKVNLMRAVLGRVAEVAQAHDVPLTLLLIPHPTDLLDGQHESVRIDRGKYGEYQPRQLTDSLRSIAESLNIDYLDLYEPFRAGDPVSLYLSGGDDHWNERGQGLAASALAERLTGTFRGNTLGGR